MVKQRIQITELEGKRSDNMITDRAYLWTQPSSQGVE